MPMKSKKYLGVNSPLGSGGEREYVPGADRILMSDEDQELLRKYQEAWQEADSQGDEAGKQAAHDGAQSVRSKYGYSGGEDGSQYVRTPETKQFTYEGMSEYVNKYAPGIEELSRAILDRPGFSYDPSTDPLYSAYKKQYTREGRRASEDTMGQYAAMTGGMPSTAAVAAGQQAGDYYAAQMADKIPELYQLAYSMYQDEGQRQRENLEMLMALEQGDYAKYMDMLAQHNTDRDFAYRAYSDDQAFRYQQKQDQISDMRYEREYADSRADADWQKQGYQSEQDYERALAKAQTLAAAGDFSGYKAMGYSDAEIASLQDAYAREQAAAKLGGSVAGSRAAADKPILTYAQTLKAIQDGRISDGVKASYDYYMGDGAYEADFGMGDDEGDGEAEEPLEVPMEKKAQDKMAKFDAPNLGQRLMGQTSNEGLTNGKFTKVQISINNALHAGQEDQAVQYVYDVWDELSESQREELIEFFNGRGYDLNP